MGCSQTLLSDAFQDRKDKAEVAGGHFGGSLWSRAGGLQFKPPQALTAGIPTTSPFAQQPPALQQFGCP